MNELLTENFDKQKWIKLGLSANSFPPEMVQGWLTLEQFDEMSENIIKKIMENKYGYTVD